jgi:hypothetical protein
MKHESCSEQIVLRLPPALRDKIEHSSLAIFTAIRRASSRREVTRMILPLSPNSLLATRVLSLGP